MSYLSSFTRYNELSVLITFTKNARNDHLAFLKTSLLSLSFLVFLEYLSEALLYSIS